MLECLLEELLIIYLYYMEQSKD